VLHTDFFSYVKVRWFGVKICRYNPYLMLACWSCKFLKDLICI